MIRAVVLDLDGVLVDSEQLWDEARRKVVARQGGRWPPEGTSDMQGMSSPEWSAYLRDRAGLEIDRQEIVDEVVDDLLALLRRELPLIPGAREAVRRLARRWPLALASSANRVVIDAVLAAADLRGAFAATVSSEEVARGKPAPDVYLEAVRRLGQSPELCVAVEDSANGIRSAASAGLRVVAVPNPHFPPSPEALALATVVLPRISELTVAFLRSAVDGGEAVEARLDEQEVESFPASDPHSDWAGPA
ncbi:MAG: HAD family phosphatase [Acidimicrobiales bacterium]|nr:HAD family phosphatase [Acidimicrobiales bacterium]